MTDCGQIEIVDPASGGGGGSDDDDGGSGGGSDGDDDSSTAYVDAINIQKSGTSASVEVEVKNEITSGFGEMVDATVRLSRNGTVVGSETIQLVAGVIEVANMDTSLRSGENEICAEVIKVEKA